MVAGSDEAAFSMQEKGAPLSGDKSPQVGFKATGQAPDIDNIPTNEQDVNDLTRLYIILLKQISYEAHIICHSKCEHKLYPGLFTRKLTAKYNSEVAQVFSSARISVT